MTKFKRRCIRTQRATPLLSLVFLLTLVACGKETDAGSPCALKAPCQEGACGFAPTEIYIDRSSGQCQQACMVDRLDNGTDGAVPADPEVLCDSEAGPAGCVSKAQLEEASYCTCRCNAPKGAAGFCECPDGFACAQVTLPSADNDGMYCRRRK